MSMGALLERIRDHLRGALTLSADQCGIRHGGTPPPAAGETYVSVDELGVQSTARDHLREVFEVEVSVWRRAGQFPDDRQGGLQLPDDPYVAGLVTLDEMERRVIQSLHANYTDITAATNAALLAGSPGSGDVFQLALYYTGRGKSELLGGRGGSAPAWIARRLKFVGMTRVQSTDVMK